VEEVRDFLRIGAFCGGVRQRVADKVKGFAVQGKA
jgi:hypothetical protein